MTEHWGVIVLAVIGGATLAFVSAWLVVKIIRLFEKTVEVDKDNERLRKWCSELNYSIQKINHRIAEMEKRMEGKNDTV